MDDSPKTREVLDDTYVRIVNEIKANAIAMIPPFVKDTEIVDIDAVAYENYRETHASSLKDNVGGDSNV